MHRHVLVSLFITSVLRHKMQVVASNNDRSLHLRFSDHSSQDSTTNSDVTGKRAFLIDVSALTRLEVNIKNENPSLNAFSLICHPKISLWHFNLNSNYAKLIKLSKSILQIVLLKATFLFTLIDIPYAKIKLQTAPKLITKLKIHY